MREALLTAKGLKDGTLTLDEDNQVATNGWGYDDEQFDALLPDHPLSRLRREMRQITASLKVSETIKQSARFPLPEV